MVLTQVVDKAGAASAAASSFRPISIGGDASIERPGKPPLDPFENNLNQPGQHEINDRCRKKDFIGRKSLGGDGFSDAGDVGERHGAGKRRGLEHADDLVGVGRQGKAERLRPDDPAEDVDAAETKCPRRFALAFINAADGASHDLCGIGAGVQGEGKDATPERFAQDDPGGTVPKPLKLSEAVIDDEQLDQSGRAAEHPYVKSSNRGEGPARLHQSPDRRGSYKSAEDQRAHQQGQRQPQTLDQLGERFEDQSDIEAHLAKCRLARASSMPIRCVSAVVNMR